MCGRWAPSLLTEIAARRMVVPAPASPALEHANSAHPASRQRPSAARFSRLFRDATRAPRSAKLRSRADHCSQALLSTSSSFVPLRRRQRVTLSSSAA